MKKLTDKQRTDYTRVALGLAGIATNNRVAEMIWRLQDMISEKQGKSDLYDVSSIQATVEAKYGSEKAIYDALIRDIQEYFDQKMDRKQPKKKRNGSK